MSEESRGELQKSGERSPWGGPWSEEPAESRFRGGRFRRSGVSPYDSDKTRRPGRLFTVFKALVLLVLIGGTAYGVINDGGLGEIRWLPMALGAMALLLLTLFVRGFYANIPRVGWVLVVSLVVLVGVKGLSMLWTLSDSDTMLEVIRSSMYLICFLLALAALSSERQVAPMMDIAVLVVVAVAGYGLLQKIAPVEYPVLSLDGVRMDSTLGYSNTTAMMLGMGVALALSRMVCSMNFVLRGLYAAVMLAFLVSLYLTVSRGGLGSLALALVVFFIISGRRLQSFANLLLACAPLAWLLWRMQSLDGLLVAGVPDEQKISDGQAFRDDLIIALVAAFVLQALYAVFVRRYELMPLGRKTLGFGVAGLGAIVVVVGAIFVVSHFGGPGRTVTALTNNPALTGNSVDRLASLSIGFRADYWSVAWDYWREHPFTGSGAGTFSFVWSQYRPVNTGVEQVHNVYLEQGVETGVAAFAALALFAVVLVALTARATLRSTGERRVLLSGLLATLLVYLISSALEWHWYIPPSTMFFFILAGMTARYALSPEWSAPLPREREDTPQMEAPEALEEP